MPNNGHKTKKQHYVPRCYLEAWAIPNKYQVYVYDKKQNAVRVNSINDVASENFFYDVKPKDVFSEQLLEAMRNAGMPINGDEPSQGIEHTFAKEVEEQFSKLMKGIIQKVKTATPWIYNNCFFISQDKKYELAALIAIQYIRTKEVRKKLTETADCLAQVLQDMGASDDVLKKYRLPKEKAKNIHAQMLMDIDNLSELTMLFASLTWVLGVNKTNKKFYTSDNPIYTIAHEKHPILSMSGISSRGVEAVFPISPDCVLVMYDGTYHKSATRFEKKYIMIDKEEYIDYYNCTCATHSERCIFSTDGDISIIDTMLRDKPDIFKVPHTQLNWGNKKYYPIS